MTTRHRSPDPAWIAGAALTVLSAAAVAAVTLTTTVSAGSAAAAPPEGRVVAASLAAPAPVTVAFPAPPAAAAPAAPRVAPQAAPQAAPKVAAPAPPAAAPRPVDPRCTGEGWQQRRGEAAVERLRRPADARAVPVAFRPARPDVLGLADLPGRSVQLFVRSCERQSDDLLLHVLAHELGHVLDAARMTDDLREQWKAARGIPAETPWFGCDGCRDFATPAGDFAETYAQWQRRAATSRSELAPAPSAAELESLAARFF